MSSQKFTDVAAYQAYVQQFAAELISAMFFGFTTGALVTPHEGVKGKKTLTELTLTALSTRYSKTFAPISEAIGYKPRTLSVENAKIDLKVVPKEMEGNYLGALRQKGQNSMDWPVQAYVLDKIVKKVQQEKEHAIWQGVSTAIPAATDLLAAIVDGLHHIITDEITATNLTAVTTGALTATNAVASVEACYAELGGAYMDGEVDIWMSMTDRIKLIQDYRTRYGNTYFAEQGGALKLDIGNAVFRFSHGIKENAILITPKENIHYGYDLEDDSNLINFEQEDRSLKMWMDYKFGVNFGIVDNDIIVVNDQH